MAFDNNGLASTKSRDVQPAAIVSGKAIPERISRRSGLKKKIIVEKVQCRSVENLLHGDDIRLRGMDHLRCLFAIGQTKRDGPLDV